MKIVRVEEKRDLLERLHAVDAIPAMKLRKLRAQHQILGFREDPVAYVFVERHSAAEGRELVDHAAAEDCVGGSLTKWLNQTGQFLRRVLTVAVDHRYEIEAFLDGVCVSDLLVAPVSLVVFVP